MNLRPLRVVLPVIPPVRELDLVGVVDVFATANAFLPPDRHYHLELVTSSAQGEHQGNVRTSLCGHEPIVSAPSQNDAGEYRARFRTSGAQPLSKQKKSPELAENFL